MLRGGLQFEVQVYKTDHWVLSAVFPTEDEARRHGSSLLSAARAEGIRVVKDWTRIDGRHVETEIHTEFRAATKAMTVAPVDEAPQVCTALPDYYAADSRMMMTRILRNYTERLVVTPTEILHNHGELKRLLDKDNLVPLAVGRIAALQAEKAGMDGRTRRDEIYDAVNRMTERARLAGQRNDLPEIGAAGFAEAIERLSGEEPEERAFLGKVVLSRDLVQMRNWFAKLDFLGELVQQDGGAGGEPLALLDGAMADVMVAPSVAQELLGMQSGLGEALCNLIDLSRGRLDPGDRGEDDRALRVSELLAFHDLEETRGAVLDLVRRQLKGTAPLQRRDPSAERDAFDIVLARTATPQGVVGGGSMAEALVQRYMRFLEAGGATGRRQAIVEVTGRIEDGKDRVRFLIALTQSEIGRQHRQDIAAQLAELTTGPGALARFVKAGHPIKENLEALTALYGEVSASPLPEPMRNDVSDAIDGLLVTYIVGTKVVERLDNPTDLLRHRANRLMQLCSPGTLQSRKALAIVRQRVVNHLRQPNFEHAYVADIADPILQQKALRDFYKLLGQAGFR
ncbi:hypothetical protein HL658_19790 [Azospirillum sp. RWY-5-1]|uniref:Uncharacterized protein n=1 Tax=Azospirillum oleiclasticum TaxID=2735135 RepID=A0ABX2TGS1_9PROT|nr:hypothetical protein [Azospirillum oleiclasticum]NYZ14795.1 hypothetical protein [Azospirillum oleiclasticum]NYZ22219.1 hypothetical protein [Azospirillum oleiclasticum]